MSKKVEFDEWMLREIPDYDPNIMAEFIRAYDQARLELFFEKDKQYGGSWMRDGVIGAYFNLKRKADRVITKFRQGILFADLGDDVTGESNLDTFMDLSNYTGMNAAFVFLTCKDKSVFDVYCKKIPPLSSLFDFNEKINRIQLKDNGNK